MLLTVMAVASLALAQETDTTLEVRPGTRLKADNYGGSITVRSWARSAVRIQASHSSRTRILIDVTATAVIVKSEGRMGPAQMVDYELSVPKWMGVSLQGVYTDIAVEGTEGNVVAETVEGDVELRGGNGTIGLKSVEGDITVTGARGRLDVNSVEGEIRLTDVAGDIVIETVDGDVVLERIDSPSVEANTVDGDITYDGTIKDGGRYRFATHDGDVAVAVAERANVTVAVSTFDGEFDSCFPVRVGDTSKHRFSFVLGSGSARLELESFDGDITLCRPGQLPGRESEEHGHDGSW